MHIMFSFVVIPFVLGLIKDNDSAKLTKAFAFFERMATSESADVTKVLEFTIIENLIASGAGVYDVAKTYMARR